MTLYSVSVLLLLLAASQAQAKPVPETEEEDLQQEEIIVDISESILAINNRSADFLLEGDLLPPKNRNAIKCSFNSCLWPKGSDGLVSIPYTISNEFSHHETQVITSALSDFHTKTCIRFVPHQNNNDYISIENQSGCFSSLGRQGGRQVLSLNKWGCVHHGIVQHEFNHALGFQHEQTRSDRDQYVDINWNNIEKRQAHNFQQYDTNNLNTPYDYSSIMHYGRTAFSINGRDTITPKKRVQIGQRQALSFWDIKRINMLYRC
ncbi:high choriolytic enzyme 1-like [Eucyclogobius newberryi]|uniref:high choriolytic enzyme 1-like n=1 Tax=Eucyclogobius newberryi TaxID=166745 RepID=UPI003B59A621